MFNRFSFDSAYPFRRYPWLYVLLGVVSLGIVALFAWLVISQWGKIGTRTTIETPAQKIDRIEVMNILNRFQLDEGQIEIDIEPDERIAKRREHIAAALGRLKAVDSDGPLATANQELIKLFSNWDFMLQSGEDAGRLRSEFIALGQKYPWMNTLLWLIMLNRL